MKSFWFLKGPVSFMDFYRNHPLSIEGRPTVCAANALGQHLAHQGRMAVGEGGCQSMQVLHPHSQKVSCGSGTVLGVGFTPLPRAKDFTYTAGPHRVWPWIPAPEIASWPRTSAFHGARAIQKPLQKMSDENKLNSQDYLQIWYF